VDSDVHSKIGRLARGPVDVIHSKIGRLVRGPVYGDVYCEIGRKAEPAIALN
jgi:hypothetical protein